MPGLLLQGSVTASGIVAEALLSEVVADEDCDLIILLLDERDERVRLESASGNSFRLLDRVIVTSGELRARLLRQRQQPDSGSKRRAREVLPQSTARPLVALLLVIMGGGIRWSEVLRAEVCDFEWAHGSIEFATTSQKRPSTRGSRDAFTRFHQLDVGSSLLVLLFLCLGNPDAVGVPHARLFARRDRDGMTTALQSLWGREFGARACRQTCACIKNVLFSLVTRPENMDDASLSRVLDALKRQMSHSPSLHVIDGIAIETGTQLYHQALGIELEAAVHSREGTVISKHGPFGEDQVLRVVRDFVVGAEDGDFAFREGQQDAALLLTNHPDNNGVVCLPCGAGKQVVWLAPPLLAYTTSRGRKRWPLIIVITPYSAVHTSHVVDA